MEEYTKEKTNKLIEEFYTNDMVALIFPWTIIAIIDNQNNDNLKNLQEFYTVVSTTCLVNELSNGKIVYTSNSSYTNKELALMTIREYFGELFDKLQSEDNEENNCFFNFLLICLDHALDIKKLPILEK